MTGGRPPRSIQHADHGRSKISRLVKITLVLILIAVSVLILLTLDAYFWSSPVHPVNSPIEWLFINVILADGAVLMIGRYGLKSRLSRKFSTFVRRASRITRRFLFERRTMIARSIPWALFAFAVLWVPEYLVQPLWTDHEHMLVMAHFWDRGDFPWSAMRTYQFPGGMETAWLAARLFGWDEPRGFFAMNLGLIGLAGITMVAWSRRNLGFMAYGFLGFLALTFVEAAQPFTGVAQRDSQSTWLAMTAVLAPSAFRSRNVGLLLSASSLALAVAIRPHALIFVPIVICSILQDRISEEKFERNRFRGMLADAIRSKALCLWLFCFIAGSVIFLSPILGIHRSSAFLEALRFPLTQPGDYSRGAFAFWSFVLEDSLSRQRNLLFLLFCIAMIVVEKAPKWRCLAIGLLAIFACVVIYRAAHPVDHGYMKLPMQFWTCLGVMVFPAWLISKFRSIPTFSWISFLGGVAILSMTPTPLFVSFEDWPAAVRDLAGIRPLEHSPPGAQYAYPPPPVEYHYTWTDTKAAERWINENSSDSTRILNLLSYHPYPAFLGTLGKLPIGRLESFVMLSWFKRYDFDSEILESLESAPRGSLVIWDNERTNPVHHKQIGKSTRFIRDRFVPAARFREIEIWIKP